jgi:tetratricopeptide (TPR) repeat protein
MMDAGLRMQPQSAELYLSRGVLYVQLANYDKAEADFDKAERPNFTQARLGSRVWAIRLFLQVLLSSTAREQNRAGRSVGTSRGP